MDKEELQKNIALYYSRLLPEAQAVFSSTTWLETIKTIALKYSLDDKQTETLGTETTLVLLGIVSLDEYEKILITELGLPGELAKKTFGEINDLILKPIRPKLIEVFNDNINQDVGGETEGVSAGQELDEKFKNLPETVQKAIRESNYQASLYEIMQENDLNVEQMGTLEDVVVGLINGVVPNEKFKEVVKSKLGVPDNKVSILVDAINEKILKEIRSKMREVFSKAPAENSSTQTKNDANVLNSAGIKIVEEKETLPVPEKLELLGKETIHPALAQKFAGISQTPVVETQHSLENLTKNPEVPVKPVSAYPKNADPYRLPPE